MLQKTSNNFRGFFLKEFTNELLKNSETASTKQLKEQIKLLQEKQEFKDKIKKKLKEKAQANFPTDEKNLGREGVQWREGEILQESERHQINFKKLTRPIKDTEVSLITCLGENEYIIIKKHDGDVKKTFIILNKEDINEIIKIFSEQGRTFFTDGVLKSYLQNLILKTSLSDLVEGRFSIQKQ